MTTWTKPLFHETCPIADQIAELKRELALRERVYPGFVERGRMTKAEADQHYERLRSALKTLLEIAAAESLRASG